MINYYYKIPKDDLIYDMVRFSLISLGINENPTLEDLKAHRANMKTIVDSETKDCFFIIKMGIDFSTPFKGMCPCNKKEILELLNQSNWEHNK